MVSPNGTAHGSEVYADVIIDRETVGGYRHVIAVNLSHNFLSAVETFKKQLPRVYKNVVQFVNPETGDTIKGPKFDNTTQQVSGRKVSDLLNQGINQKPPFEEDMPHEPRDRYQENTNMNELNKFRGIINECLKEIKSEKNPRFRLKESLRNVVKSVLSEMSSNVPLSEREDKDEQETIQKRYNKKGNERLNKTNDKLQQELESLVHGIDDTWDVYWDDKGDLNVRAHNLLQVRISTNFENNFNIFAMVKLVDKIRAIALTWDQVKNFIKANFADLKTTKADDAKKKALDHYKDRDVIKKAAGPMSDVVKNRGEKNNGEDAKLKTTKKDNQNYKTDAVEREEDLPDKEMKQVVEPGKDPDGKNHNISKTTKVKPPKHDKSPTTLRPADKATPKFRKKKD